VAVGWEALDRWGDDVARIEPLTGGVGVNEVWSVRVNGQLAVGRLGKRGDADLSWGTDLLRHLDREGMTVTVPIPTMDGRHFAEGLVVMTSVEANRRKRRPTGVALPTHRRMPTARSGGGVLANGSTVGRVVPSRHERRASDPERRLVRLACALARGGP